ncbi:HesB/IscA family protein [Gilvimarinus xylanilyticus]|uniref:Iron-sulfur cluster assembly accessory protein n=1 Tax=Gilvimarinus xylanilyticus TaxID=2944139 RepID=A0A9X2I238_9GAMM|nr:iron-sulfur cluster assembly accessory protein [Gilvimarinus xylanilyticus]MCP8898731.1 iron-sulfur cluster assembly accessory protein [Gilvimarinus xylanilyticus]
MTVQDFDPQAAPVEITDQAAAHFRKQLAADSGDAKGVRLSIKESGCTGYMYVLDLVAQPEPGDQVISLADGVEVYLDPASLPVISGTKIDFITEGVNRQLAFINPNARDYCGCGESFNIG